MARGHLAYYRALEEEGHVRVVTDRVDLDESWSAWEAWEVAGASGPPPPLGVIFSMECADAILDPEQLEEWYQLGLRLIGPGHFGPGRYGGGTFTELGLTDMGPALLIEMDRLGIALDMSHTSDQTFWESLEHCQGPILAEPQRLPGAGAEQAPPHRRNDHRHRRARRRHRRHPGQLAAAPRLDRRRRQYGRGHPRAPGRPRRPHLPADRQRPPYRYRQRPRRRRRLRRVRPRDRHHRRHAAHRYGAGRDAATQRTTSPASCTATGCASCEHSGASG